MSENDPRAAHALVTIRRMHNTAATLDDHAAYRIVCARDARFDGQLFVAVTSTGVYCRPICRVRTPLRANCRFFASAARAEAARFRPCLKCRPEIAPGAAPAWSVMDASGTLARQAAALLDEQIATGAPGQITRLARRLGVTDRQLRRIFEAEHGVPPMRYLLTRRLLLAKQLLTDTALPVTQVALSSGFTSARRFSANFQTHYRMSPGRLRQGAPARTADADAVSVQLAYRPPYDVQGLLRFLDKRSIPGVEQVHDGRVRRSVRAGLLGAAPGWIEAEFAANAARVTLRFAPQLARDSARVIAAARRWLDLNAVPEAIDSALHDLPGAPGVRLPGGLDAFELMVRAVLGQQVSVAASRTLAHRLVGHCGAPLATPWPGVHRAFPAPPALASAGAGALGALGILPSRARTIVSLAQRWPEIEPCLGAPARPGALIERLLALPGIGAWTAQYVAMRVLGWPDAFPPGDVAVKKAMRTLFQIDRVAALEARAGAWRPWRAYAVLRLWNSLEASVS